MTELILVLTPIFLMVLTIHGAGRIGRVLRDRRIDAEIEANTWSA